MWNELMVLKDKPKDNGRKTVISRFSTGIADIARSTRRGCHFPASRPCLGRVSRLALCIMLFTSSVKADVFVAGGATENTRAAKPGGEG
jgi:hypothetical protein